jgi:alpha-1,6-glucosidase-like protein
VPGMAHAELTLSPVQARGADPVVKASRWDAGAGTVTVPARTVAVFVQH